METFPTNFRCPHLASSKKISGTILLMLAAFFHYSFGQTFYAGGSAGLYEITINGSSCTSTFIGPFLETGTGNNVFSGDIAICPDGSLYITDNSNLWEVDPATGACTLVASSSTYLGIVGLGCAGNGIVYGTAFGFNGSVGILYEMNANTGTITALGDMGFSSAGDMVNYNGTWYMTSTAGLVEVDVANPSNSILVQPGVVYVAMTVFPNECNTLLGGDGDNLFLIDIETGNTSNFCTVPGVQMGGLTTIAEFSTLPTSCDPTLDLDFDDSSGAAMTDFNAPNFNCSNASTGVNIADLDAVIDSPEPINTLTVNIAAGNPDGPNEILELLSANNITIAGSGTGTLTLTNAGGAVLQDFVDALTSIVYKNQLVPPTPGVREIEVSFTTISNSQSNVATAFVTVDAYENLEVDLGPDQSVCPNETVVLDAGNPGADFIWSNGSTGQVISVQAPGLFAVTVSDGINCPGTDEVELTLSPVYTLELGGDEVICEGGKRQPRFFARQQSTDH